jgi:hypothetical protein
MKSQKVYMIFPPFPKPKKTLDFFHEHKVPLVFVDYYWFIFWPNQRARNFSRNPQKSLV